MSVYTCCKCLSIPQHCQSVELLKALTQGVPLLLLSLSAWHTQVPWYFEGTTHTATQGDIQVSTLINNNTATIVPATGTDSITSEPKRCLSSADCWCVAQLDIILLYQHFLYPQA